MAVARRPLSLPRLSGGASPAAFGAGRSMESFGGGAGPEAYGAGLISPGAPVPSTWGRDLQQLGQIAEGVGEAVLAVERRDQTIRARGRLQELRRTAVDQYGQWEQQAPPDANGFAKSVDDRYQEWRGKQVDGLSGAEREIIDQGLAEYGAALYGRAEEFEAATKRQFYKNAISDSVERARDTVFRDPGEFDRELGDLAQTIEESELPDPAKDALVSSAASSLTESLWRRRMHDDPLEATAALLSQEIPHLSADDRMALVASADGEMRRALGERALVEMSTEQLLRARDAAQADLLAASIRGRATPADIDRAVMARAISPELAAETNDALAGGGGDDRLDASSMLGLMLRASTGDKLVLNEAAQMAAMLRISRDQIDEVAADLEQYQRPDGVLSRQDVRAAEAKLHEIIDESGFGFEDGNAEAAVDGLRLFRDRMIADPKADPAEIAEGIEDDWRARRTKAVANRLIMKPDGSGPDIEASATEIMEWYQEGEIDDFTFAAYADALELYKTKPPGRRR